MRDFVGTLRIYSLLDLILFLLIFKLTLIQTIGFILAHIGFLFFLEYKHKHSYRESFHWIFWALPSFLGILFSQNYIPVLLFLIFGYLYAQKDKSYFATLSPVFRGLQHYSISAFLLSPTHIVSILSLGLFFLRNVLGDFRDVKKDLKEGMKTIPILFGLKYGLKYVHLIGTITTTIVWSYFLNLSIITLFTVVIIQILTYNITKR